jgi:hypothetical protein
MNGRPPALLEPLAVWDGGWQELVTVPNPAAGGGYTYTVEGQYTSRPLAVHFRVVTDGTAGNRTITLKYQDDAGIPFLSMGAPVTIPASSTYDVSFWRLLGQPDWPIVTTIVAPLADVFLFPGWQLALGIDTVKATDQLSRIRILWERYSTDGPR